MRTQSSRRRRPVLSRPRLDDAHPSGGGPCRGATPAAALMAALNAATGADVNRLTRVRHLTKPLLMPVGLRCDARKHGRKRVVAIGTTPLYPAGGLPRPRSLLTVGPVASRGGRSWPTPTGARSLPLSERSQFRGADEDRSRAMRRLEEPRSMDAKRPRAVSADLLRRLRNRNETGWSGGDLDGDR
jgi:hypothetical protein